MILQLRPDQQQILEMATASGMSAEEVLDQAFTIIRMQHQQDAWMLANRDEIAAQIEEGWAQAQRGDLVDCDQVLSVLEDDRKQRMRVRAESA